MFAKLLEFRFNSSFSSKLEKKLLELELGDSLVNKEVMKRELRRNLTRREQEIPHFYKWWDELR